MFLFFYFYSHTYGQASCFGDVVWDFSSSLMKTQTFVQILFFFVVSIHAFQDHTYKMAKKNPKLDIFLYMTSVNVTEINIHT